MPKELLQEFQQLQNDGPIDLFAFLSSRTQSSYEARLKVVLHDLQERWRTGKPLKVEEYLERLPELANDPDAVIALVKTEQQAQFGIDTTPETSELAIRFPLLAGRFQEQIQKIDSKPPEAQDADPFRTLSHDTDSSNAAILSDRYRMLRLLGQGAFGRVYLALDLELERQVAIKVPLAERFQAPRDADIYLAEARMVASLNHPHIVPVYDMGRTPEGAVFVVSRFIEGTTLEERLKSNSLPVNDLVRLLKTVAEALHYAHGQRLIHRDVKPANILIEESTRTPFVADFGLAIREEDYAKQGGIAGTPTYMSPEQARGEGHRLDGRSDMFSLGVIMYEALTGQRPFRGGTLNELLHQIVSVEPRLPRSLRSDIPSELERICLKSLNKRVSDRYASAASLADDLAAWLEPKSTLSIQPGREEQIVPKGLRSFDSSDASYFLDLMPGLRNRKGLPESIAFWKQRIEQIDPDQTFSVGLLYGPSGCGKSSLVKAGLIPHLDIAVVAIYVEATPDETEVRILRGLRKRVPELSEQLGLADTLAALRRAQGRKVVIIIDQFEQWLHAHRIESQAELIAALRHCDGRYLQAIVMVRDDFAMAASRFMRALDTRILEGHNFATVDLFEVDHAVKVLTKFGQAFGKLPAQLSKLTEPERDFVNDVATGLAVDNKVVSVRLSLFADMIRNKPWTAATLTEVGGTQGVGVNFLEETFSSRDANPDHRLHAVAARSILNTLLPELGTDIKGHMRSRAELLEASGYQDRPSDFNELLRILDGELRLITPTDPEGLGSQSKSDLALQYFQLTHDYLVPSLREWLTRKQQETRKGRAELKLAERASTWNTQREAKQLPTLWEWLNICILTRSLDWTAVQREMMSHAGSLHGLRFGMATASLAAVMALGVVVRGQVLQRQEATRIEGLVGRLVSADPSQLPEIVKQLDVNSPVATPYLSPMVTMDAKTVDEKRTQLHARLAMVVNNPSLVEPLLEELFTNKVAYIGPIRHQLRPYAGDLIQRLQAILRDENVDSNRRLRAAVALAEYIPESDANSWTEHDLEFVARQLVASNAESQLLLRENLRSISGRLLPDLEKLFGNAKATDAQRLSAANAFADYAARDIPKLSQLLTVATPEQFGVLYPLVANVAVRSANEAGSSDNPRNFRGAKGDNVNNSEDIIGELHNVAATLPPAELGSVERVPYGQRRANAAVTLLRLGEREKVLPVFDMTDDPEALTQFIFRCRSRGVRVDELLDLLQTVTRQESKDPRTNARIRYALLLTLGEFTLSEIPESRREILIKQLADSYRNDPSASVHGAAGWLLRQWGQTDIAREVDQTPVPYSTEREWFTLAITVSPTSPDQPKEKPTEEKEEKVVEPESLPPKTFYYTFIVFPAGKSEIGSVSDEPGRRKDEVRHSVTLTRSFALLDREVTLEELIAFSPSYTNYMQQYGAHPSDAGFSAHWYDSVAFCRWLGQQSGLSEVDQPHADPKSLDKDAYPREPMPTVNWAPRNWPLELGRRGFRLPTDSEWEIASRTGGRTAYGYGSEEGLLVRFGWFSENSGEHVHPPRELRPSLGGLFDLHGNLYEWTYDWHQSFDGTAVVDPLVSERGADRVGRGGSWGLVAGLCRSAFRIASVPTSRSDYRGFRLALSPSVQSTKAEQEKK